MKLSHTLVAGLALLSMVSPSLAIANSVDGESFVAADSVAPPTNRSSSLKPGPAWKIVGGTVKQIKGNVYMVEDYDGNQVQLHVSRDTKQLRGNKKVGDRVRAEITKDGFANSIQ
jgi:hypothetical protein